jgi:conjugal transfer pilus assembly protein TraW
VSKVYHSALASAVFFAAAQMQFSVSASDFGVQGQTWEIAENDLLASISAKLANMASSGQIDAFNQKFASRVKEKVINPPAVDGISFARAARQWFYDPSLTIDQDLKDTKGNIIAARGTRVNPLDYAPLAQSLIFIDGRSEDEMRWLLNQPDLDKSKVIFTGGSPFNRMKQLKRRFYFDQSGILTSKFGVKHTPARIVQEGDLLSASEYEIVRKQL